jgi:hypothetical protein
MPLDYKQSSFKGGIHQELDATKIPDLGDSYYLGVNIRNREDVLQPVKSPLNLTNTFTAGKVQGLYGAGTILLLFVDGKPFFRDVSDTSSSNFKALVNTPNMDDTVDYIYAEFVPSSTLGYARLKIPGQQQVQFDLNQELPFISSVQGVIYSDGVSQPALILDNNTTVQTLNTYAQWSLANREYVPKMKQMLYFGGILYAASANGKELYHSVTGRPLDFVIPVNDDGDKVSSEEAQGGASATSKRIDFESITAIKTTPADGVIVVGTQSRIFIVGIDEQNLQFSEPTFSAFPIAAVGVPNNFCFVDINGDTAFISHHGIDSINASAVLKQESRNSPVSAAVSRLFQSSPTTFVAQDFPCAFQFGADFAFFAVNTIYGPAILIYDRTTKTFISLDKYDGVGQIKMFANVIVKGERRLFFITTDNQLYEAFAGDTIETSEVLIGEWCSNDPKISQSPLYLHLVFTECQSEGEVTITPIINRQKGNSKTQTLLKKISAPIYPIKIPFDDSLDSTQIVSFALKGTIQAGWKVGFNIKWNVNAKLTHINLTSESQTAQVNQQAKSGRYTSLAS